jgi:hypothetical protein
VLKFGPPSVLQNEIHSEEDAKYTTIFDGRFVYGYQSFSLQKIATMMKTVILFEEA